METLPEISNKWAFLAFALFQVFQLVKSHLDTKAAAAKAESATSKAKAEIEEQRAITAQRRDTEHQLLTQRVASLEDNQKGFNIVITRMDDKLNTVAEGIAFIRGKLTPAGKRSNYVIMKEEHE